jgi:hypothetical protein
MKEESIGPFIVCVERGNKDYMTMAHRARLRELLKYTTKDFIRHILVPIVRQQAPVSLRVLDWLCINYAKKNNIGFVINAKNNSSRWFNIHLEYRKKMNAYKRRLFDPFQRRGRIYFEHHGVMMETTVAQISFLQWASKYGVYDYAIQHHASIESCMTKSMQLAKSRELTDKKRKRSALTKSPPSDAFYFQDKVVIVCDSEEDDETDEADEESDLVQKEKKKETETQIDVVGD